MTTTATEPINTKELQTITANTISLKGSIPLRPNVPEALTMISAPTFASRCALPRNVPSAKPTVKIISSTPTAIPKTLTKLRIGRWRIFENVKLAFIAQRLKILCENKISIKPFQALGLSFSLSY